MVPSGFLSRTGTKTRADRAFRWDFKLCFPECLIESKEHMWQSQVEIEHYSIACFSCVAAFEALQHETSIKGRAHTHCIDAQIPDQSMQCV